MKLSRKTIRIVALAIMVAALLSFYVANKISDNKTYSKLQKAVAAQSYADKLSDPQRSSVECYPEGKSSTCLAIYYSLPADFCRDIARRLNGKEQPDSGCEFAQNIQQYDGYKVVYQVAEASNSGYRLTASIR